MRRINKILLVALLSLSPLEGWCCTSVIISGSVRKDGRPIMLKHRDAGCLDNAIRRFQGAKYSFIGLVNSPSEGGEVWTGLNSVGFGIMNTATYDLKDDDLPASEMDKEGAVMFKALGICRSVDDFQALLDTLPKPWGCEANFGIIDAHGGAAYFEVNNHSYTRFNVADEPGGYMVVTNFTRTGRLADRKGVDRFQKASQILSGLDVSTLGHKELINQISRSGKPIIRDITSASLVIEGIREGEDPSNAVMWTVLGCPYTSPYIPLQVSRDIPTFMTNFHIGDASDYPYDEASTASPDGATAPLCDISLTLKENLGFDKGCVEECRKIEAFVDRRFKTGMSSREYSSMLKRIWRRYKHLNVKFVVSGDVPCSHT